MPIITGTFDADSRIITDSTACNAVTLSDTSLEDVYYVFECMSYAGSCSLFGTSNDDFISFSAVTGGPNFRTITIGSPSTPFPAGRYLNIYLNNDHIWYESTSDYFTQVTYPGPISGADEDVVVLDPTTAYWVKPGCTINDACNYNSEYTYPCDCLSENNCCEGPGSGCDGACPDYPGYPDDYNCSGECIAEGTNLDEDGLDCSGVCGGTAVENTCGTCVSAGNEDTDDGLDCPDDGGNDGCANLPTGCYNGGSCCDCVGTNQILFYQDQDVDGTANCFACTGGTDYSGVGFQDPPFCSPQAYYCDGINNPDHWYTSCSETEDDECPGDVYDDCEICNSGDHVPNSDQDCNLTCFGDASDDNICNYCVGGSEEPASLYECVPDCLGAWFVRTIGTEGTPENAEDCMGVCNGPNEVDVLGNCCHGNSIIPHFEDLDGDGLGDGDGSSCGNYCAGFDNIASDCVPNHLDCPENNFDNCGTCVAEIGEDYNCCYDSTACNNNELEDCIYVEEYHDCNGCCTATADEEQVLIGGFDCAGTCGGDAVDIGCGCGEPAPSGCNNACGSTAELDECSVCGGSGIPEGDCDCEGNVLDCAGECGGSTIEDCAGECGGSATDAGCGCGEAGPSGCDNVCGSTAVVDCAGECGGSAGIQTYWYDNDGDGLGNPNVSWDFCSADVSCGEPGGWCSDYSDLDDTEYCLNNAWDCTGDCDGTAIEDDCGVCEGDGSSCADCGGIPNGDSYLDMCEECRCGATVAGTCSEEADCVQDCGGEWGGTKTYDACGVCNGNGLPDGFCNCNFDVCDCTDYDCVNSFVAGTDGAVGTNDNPACNGDAVEDGCGVCNGSDDTCDEGCTDSNACNYCSGCEIDDGSCTYAEENYNCDGGCAVETDCLGDCNGDLLGIGDGYGIDECDVCGGDGTSCLDCAGTPNGLALVDNCDVCDTDSTNDCVQDCAGTWGGSATIQTYWYDDDGDELGNPNASWDFCSADVSCGEPGGWCSNNTDEDDACFNNAWGCDGICDSDLENDACDICGGDCFNPVQQVGCDFGVWFGESTAGDPEDEESAIAYALEFINSESPVGYPMNCGLTTETYIDHQWRLTVCCPGPEYDGNVPDPNPTDLWCVDNQPELIEFVVVSNPLEGVSHFNTYGAACASLSESENSGCEPNHECSDCAGIPNGGAVVDECGVCGGDGILEGDCDCGGNTLDNCGVCGGDNSCYASGTDLTSYGFFEYGNQTCADGVTCDDIGEYCVDFKCGECGGGDCALGQCDDSCDNACTTDYYNDGYNDGLLVCQDCNDTDGGLDCYTTGYNDGVIVGEVTGYNDGLIVCQDCTDTDGGLTCYKAGKAYGEDCANNNCEVTGYNDGLIDGDALSGTVNDIQYFETQLAALQNSLYDIGQLDSPAAGDATMDYAIYDWTSYCGTHTSCQQVYEDGNTVGNAAGYATGFDEGVASIFFPADFIVGGQGDTGLLKQQFIAFTLPVKCGAHFELDACTGADLVCAGDPDYDGDCTVEFTSCGGWNGICAQYETDRTLKNSVFEFSDSPSPTNRFTVGFDFIFTRQGNDNADGSIDYYNISYQSGEDLQWGSNYIVDAWYTSNGKNYLEPGRGYWITTFNDLWIKWVDPNVI